MVGQQQNPASAQQHQTTSTSPGSQVPVPEHEHDHTGISFTTTAQDILQYLSERRGAIAHLYHMFAHYKESLIDFSHHTDCVPGFELLRNQLPVLLPDEFLDKNRDGPGAGFAIYVQTAGGSTVLLPLVLEGAGVLSDVHFDDLDAWFDSGSDITMHYNRLTDSCSTKLLRASSYQGSPPSDALLDRVAQAAALAFREQVPWAVVFNGPRYLTVCLEGNHVTFDSSSRTSGMGHGELGVDFVHMLMLLTSYNLLCIKKRKSTKQR